MLKALKRPRSLSFWTFSLFLLGIALEISAVEHPRFFPSLQFILALLFILAQSAWLQTVFNRVFRANTTHWVHFAVLLYGIVWGRANFMSSFYHDEFGYFETVGQNLFWSLNSLLRPLNEHFTPLTKFVQWIVYNTFGANYFGIAWANAFAFVLFLHTFFYFVLALSNRLTVAVMGAALIGVSIEVGENHIWKAAGLSLFITTGLFFLWLYLNLQVLDKKRPINLKTYLLLTFVSAGSVYSSSLITLPVLYLIPVVYDRLKKLKPSFLVSFGLFSTHSIFVSCSYFYLRKTLTGFNVPIRSEFDIVPLMSMLGEFIARALIDVGTNRYFSVLIVAVFFLGPWSFVFLSRRKISKDKGWPQFFVSGLSLLGVEVLLIGLAQIWVGRGVILTADHLVRYLYFPIIGVFLYWVGFYWVWSSMPSSSSLLRKIAVVFLVLAVFNHFRTKEYYPVSYQTMLNESRRLFFERTQTLLCEVSRLSRNEYRTWFLPDLPLGDTPRIHDLGVTDPFNRYPFSYFAGMYLSSCFDKNFVKFVPYQRLSHDEYKKLASHPEISEFYLNYFGMDLSLSRLSED